jgi:hypothetical protein
MRRTAITAPPPPSEGEQWLRGAVGRPDEPEPPAPVPARLVPGAMPVPPPPATAEAELRAYLDRAQALPSGWQPLA